jgi:hypothetical protein
MALITESLAGDVTEPVLAQSLHDPPTASGPESPLHQNLQPKPFKFSASGQGEVIGFFSGGGGRNRTGVHGFAVICNSVSYVQSRPTQLSQLANNTGLVVQSHPMAFSANQARSGNQAVTGI